VTPFAVFYGSEARAYATLMFFATLAALALLLAVERRQRRWWALYALASTAVLYSHYIGGFVVAAGAAWALWTERERWREVVIAHLAIGLAFLPEILSPRTGGLALHGGPLQLRWSSLADLVGLFPGYPPGSGAGPEPSLTTVPGVAALMLVGAGLGVALVAEVIGRRPRGGERTELGSPAIVLLAVMAVATPAGVLMYSLSEHDLFAGRYFSASLPALLLVIAWLLTRSGSRTALLAVALVLVGVSLGTLRMLDPSNERPPYRDVARYIEDSTGAADHVIVPFEDPSQALFVGFLAQTLLEVYDVKSHPTFFQEIDDPPAWAPAARVRTVAVLVPDSVLFPRFPAYAGPGRCFVRSAQRTFEGRWHPRAAIYRLRRGDEACPDG
jgi:4-amino-4-deoxy-L-arabinose transferase-like glycosyltransferase